MSIQLAGKNVLVSGGSMGIGLAVAERCLEAGASVLICARSEAALTSAAQRLREAGHKRIDLVRADVSEASQVHTAFDTLQGRFGPLSAVIHCAGILGPIGSITDVEPEDWLEAIRVNLYGSFLVAREACRRMRLGGGGRIVLLSGGGASAAFPNYSAYGSGKVGVVRLAETLAAEMAPYGIEVNCLAPGFVLTRLHEQTLAAGEQAGTDYLARTKAEIERGGVSLSVPASAAAFLVSDLARGITGRFISAVYDNWQDWPEHISELKASDLFTLRRIVPADRGLNWQ